MPSDTLKVVVADDDELTCNLLGDLLSSFEGFSLIGKAGTGTDMLDLVRKTDPDVVLVDVQMPELDGLCAVYRLQEERPGIFIIFVTGHPKYAADAFNLNAGDYLVKPVDRERLSRALSKVKRLKKLEAICPGGEGSGQDELAAGIKNGIPQRDKLIFKIDGSLVIIDAESIFFVEGAGKKSVLHTNSSCFEICEQLSAVEKKLDPVMFFRCHKSYIINVQRVDKVIPYTTRSYDVIFREYPRKAAMRRDKFKEFCRIINAR
jgi:DNA-binding LytR/AlgR family response regulator